ncbi:unnamed protein product [Eruca vesicaria subsp. sativa]|uniref:Uncharacterized protein n=1 Tax=Eruca vesicaria subsp. sativa TaxID=29727 RepID=A0ABC8J300_ERUVS|nr:unnamed protein product [Eruca vesicaria subsp. sativa]
MLHLHGKLHFVAFASSARRSSSLQSQGDDVVVPYRVSDKVAEGVALRRFLRNATLVPLIRYRAEMSVYDNDEKATFVLLCDTGPELTWRQGSKMIDNSLRPVGTLGANHEMPTLQCLVEVSSYNFTVKRTITVTNVVSPAVLPPFVVAENNPTQSMKQHMLLE